MHSNGLKDFLIRLLGWRAMLIQGDPTVFDRWRWLRRHLSPGSSRTLDAGCGSGAFTLFAARRGNDAVGLSFDRVNMQKASARGRVLGLSNASFFEADLRQLDTWSGGLGKFDQIICLECIEHIVNDEKLLRDLTALLRPGGRLLLSAPFAQYKGLVGDDPLKLSVIEDGGHVRWGYTQEQLTGLFERVGLCLVRADYVSGFVSQQITNAIRLLARCIHYRLAWALTFILRLLVVVDYPLTRLLNYPFLSIAVVGVKPEEGTPGEITDGADRPAAAGHPSTLINPYGNK